MTKLRSAHRGPRKGGSPLAAQMKIRNSSLRLGRHGFLRFPAWDALKSSGAELLTGILLAACLLLGGATRSGSLGDVILQLTSVGVLILALQRMIVLNAYVTYKGPLIFVAAVALVPVAQLIPLPPTLWQQLPGRDLISEAYTLIGRPHPLLPISMTPEATWLGALALLPPIAIFLSVLTLGQDSRRRLSLVVIVIGVVSVFLSLVQLAQGPGSTLRFYEFTNQTEAVGFFANRNHQAALLYCATLFAAAHFVESLPGAIHSQPRRWHFDALAAAIAWLTVLIILIGGEMIARSRAGLALCILAMLAAVGMAVKNRGRDAPRSEFGKAIAGAAAAALVLFAPLAVHRIADRLGMDPNADVRLPFARNTLAAATTYMPFGSGIGSFVPVYQLFEKPTDITAVYANHAHNDLLEVWLETGVFGLALMAAFGIWFIRKASLLWTRDRRFEGADTSIRQAAFVTLLLLLAHSIVDYPLRTTALMAVAAMSAALLIAPSEQMQNR